MGLYPARHVCYSGDAPPPLPIGNLKYLRTNPPQNDATVLESATEQAKVVVGKGWEAVRNINWKDMTKKEPESNGSKMWGRLLEATAAATEQARQKVTDKYYDIRDGPYGMSLNGDGLTGQNRTMILLIIHILSEH